MILMLFLKIKNSVVKKNKYIKVHLYKMQFFQIKKHFIYCEYITVYLHCFEGDRPFLRLLYKW